MILTVYILVLIWIYIVLGRKKKQRIRLKKMSDAVCSLFNSQRWNELNRLALLTVKYHNPENLVFQHLPLKENVKNP